MSTLPWCYNLIWWPAHHHPLLNTHKVLFILYKLRNTGQGRQLHDYHNTPFRVSKYNYHRITLYSDIAVHLAGCGFQYRWYWVQKGDMYSKQTVISPLGALIIGCCMTMFISSSCWNSIKTQVHDGRAWLGRELRLQRLKQTLYRKK